MTSVAKRWALLRRAQKLAPRFWLSPAGEIYPVRSDKFHVEFLQENPQLFGLQPGQIERELGTTAFDIAKHDTWLQIYPKYAYSKGWLRGTSEPGLIAAEGNPAGADTPVTSVHYSVLKELGRARPEADVVFLPTGQRKAFVIQGAQRGWRTARRKMLNHHAKYCLKQI